MVKIVDRQALAAELSRRGAVPTARGAVWAYQLTRGGGTARVAPMPGGKYRLELLGCNC